MPTKRWHTREDSGLRLDRDGRWWHDDELIEHPKIIQAFNAGLSPTEDGRFQLKFGDDWCYVQVEGVAYRVVAVERTDDEVTISLTDQTKERLDPSTLTLAEGGVLACRVKAGRAKALFSGDAQFALGEMLESRGDRLFLRVGSREFLLPITAVPPAG